ncbi:MAG: PQQ-dependent sugar dehydrogenase, partial [Vicinamibacterales bacterium]
DGPPPTTPAGPTSTPQPPANTPTPVPSTPSRAIDLGSITLAVEQVGDGFDQPVLVTHAGDGSDRIFVLEKTGYVRLLDGSPYLDISGQVLFYGVRTTEHELGLLGLAFHPDFETNRQFFVHYINRAQDHVISRFTEGSDGRADRNSEEVLLTFPQPDINFAGGTILFGPDGYLYIGTGTGTSNNPEQIVAQELDNPYGKILRIDVDGGDPYAIPADNPFINTDGARPEVWAYGLRNPWRFAFDAANGDLYIGGPGEFQREWINFQAASTEAGRNYGWPILEGGQCWEFWTGECTTDGFELPIYSRPTYQDGNCVILGGSVYRGQQSPDLTGVYLFSDYCSGRIWGLARDESGAWRDRQLYDLPGLVSSFGEDESGELYILAIEDGVIYRIVGN